MNLASRTLRLFGQFIDGIVGVAPIIAGAVLTGINDALGVSVLVAGILWFMFYYFFADGLNDGRSLAKVWLGMRVVDAATGSPCTFGQSFVRNLVLAVAGPIDWVFIFGKRRQRLGDLAAETVVIEE